MQLENGREEKGEKKEKNPCATIRPLGRNVGPRQEKRTSRQPVKIKTPMRRVGSHQRARLLTLALSGASACEIFRSDTLPDCL